MPQIKSEGLLLKSVNWKENSKIVAIFTDNAGRISLVDRGGRSLKSKRGRLMTFCRMEISYFKSEKSGMGYIGEIEPLETFEFKSEGTLGRLTFASAALELLYDLLPEEDPQQGLFDLTVRFMRRIDRVRRAGIIPVFISYFLKTLSYLGYRPNFSGCIGCGKDLQETAVSNSNGLAFHLFSPERGGLICSACQMPGEYYIKLQSDRLMKVYNLQTSSMTESGKMTLRLEEAEELLELLAGFLKYQADNKELKSLKFLEKLKKANLKF